MRRTSPVTASAIALGCIGSLCIFSACRAIVGNYEVGPTHDAGSDSTAEIAVDSTPPVDSSTDAGLDLGSDAADGGGLLASCNAYLLAGSSKGDGIYSLAAKEGAVRVWCDMSRDGGGWRLVATKSPSTSASAWHGESAVNKTLELIDPATPGDAVLAIDWAQLGFTQVIYDLGPPPTPTRAFFTTLTTDEKNGARGALSLLPMPTLKPKCTIDGVDYPACSPPPPDGGGPPPGGDKALGWLYSPTGVSCWWAYDTSNGSQECKTAKPGGGHVWVK